MIEPVVRAALSEIIHEAAVLARAGEVEPAMRLRNAADTIRQSVCTHERGYAASLYMSGPVDKCRTCGAPRPEKLTSA